jgi:hypothetical protein
MNLLLFGTYCRRIDGICQERDGCSNCAGTDEKYNKLRVPSVNFPCPHTDFTCYRIPGCSGCPITSN